jgi:hypothetical protein
MMIRKLSVLLAVVSTTGCGLFGGDPELIPVTFEDAVTAQTAEAIVGAEVTFSNGAALTSEFSGSTTFQFTSSTAWSAESNGQSFSGSVSYGSCSFFFQSGGAFTGNPFNPCNFTFTADNSGNTKIQITLGTTASNEATVDVFQVEDLGNGLCRIKNKTTGAFVGNQFACGDGTGTGSTGVGV